MARTITKYLSCPSTRSSRTWSWFAYSCHSCTRRLQSPSMWPRCHSTKKWTTLFIKESCRFSSSGQRYKKSKRREILFTTLQRFTLINQETWMNFPPVACEWKTRDTSQTWLRSWNSLQSITSVEVLQLLQRKCLRSIKSRAQTPTTLFTNKITWLFRLIHQSMRISSTYGTRSSHSKLPIPKRTL